MPPALGRRVVETAVVTAAMKVFARRGYANARVEDILEEAGIARRTFYRYFTNKDDVLVSLDEVATTELLRRLDEGAAFDVDPVSDLMVWVDRYLDFHAENAAVCRLVMPRLAGEESCVAPTRRRVRARLLRKMVQYAEANGDAPLGGFTYVAAIAALEGVAMELLEPSATADDVTRAKHALRGVLVRGLRRG